MHMKRTDFLKITLAAVPVGLTFRSLATAKGGSGRGEVKERIGKGFIVAAGKDRNDKSISVMDGDVFFTKVSTGDTAGDLYIYESTRVKEGGPPLHVHNEQDEWWYVLQGTFMIKVGEEVYHVKAGDSVFGPRKVPHCFAKVGDGEGKLLMVFQPAGKMEAFFTAMSQGATKGMTAEQNAEFRKAHGFEVVGPPLGRLKQ